ncbi:alpha/beta hydrolase-fold protein [Microbacterium sp.]|uniref:alpha/beta hydrolase-fold protein n=1 Tax=Microbacterium sp. TaxID=51671 RepID=UPI0033410042
MSVEILTAVRSAALGNARDVFVYLPPSYEPAAGPYPVVVAHDGQHLFAARGLTPSWRLDETLDRLIGEGRIPPLVVVAPANAGTDRGAEYSHILPYPRDPRTRPRGELYESFLVGELLPLARSRYAITDDPGLTAVMGSSMGGLVSYHLAFRRPDVFGLAAILSPFLAAVDPVTFDETPVHATFAHRGPSRIWLDIGGREGLIMVRPVRELAEALIAIGYAPDAELRYRHDPEAIHHEDAWAERVESALLHLFGAGGASELLAAPTGAFAVGEVIDAAPLARRSDGCVYSALAAEVEGRPGERFESAGHALLRARSSGPATVVASLDGTVVRGEVDVVAAGSEAVLDVTILVPEDDGDDPAEAVYFSGLIAERRAPGVYRGVWRLPRGVGLNGTVSRGWRIDGLDGEGRLVRSPLRVDRDQTVEVRIASWTVPGGDDPHHS